MLATAREATYLKTFLDGWLPVFRKILSVVDDQSGGMRSRPATIR